MFKQSETAGLEVDIKLISTVFSSSNVLGYMFEMSTPPRLTLTNIDLMLQKLRKLQHDRPIELLVHHEQIFNKLFEILSLDYDTLKCTDAMNTSAFSLVEERSDVAF